MSVLNIIELQNVVTSATGLSPTAYLSNQLMNIQEMVQYDQKRINVNLISNFNTTPIQFLSPVSFSSMTSSNTNTLGTTSSGVLSIGGTPNALMFSQNGTPTFYITALGAATFTGTVSAQNFITTSDVRQKTEIMPIENSDSIISSLRGIRFKWTSSGAQDIGLIAQDLLPLLPEAVIESPGGLQVAYMKVIPVLVEAVKALTERVAVLEGRLV